MDYVAGRDGGLFVCDPIANNVEALSLPKKMFTPRYQRLR
jgi:hypothetical protein